MQILAPVVCCENPSCAGDSCQAHGHRQSLQWDGEPETREAAHHNSSVHGGGLRHGCVLVFRRSEVASSCARAASRCTRTCTRRRSEPLHGPAITAHDNRLNKLKRVQGNREEERSRRVHEDPLVRRGVRDNKAVILHQIAQLASARLQNTNTKRRSHS